MLLWSEPQVSEATNGGDCDVIVYGATPGGFCAAIAAAREGASVVLIEPTGHIGAMSTGGLSHCDSNQMVRSTVMGLFDEWHHRIVKDYVDRGLPSPYQPSVKDQSLWTFEPHVAMKITKQMLSEAGVQTVVDCGLISVKKQGSKIQALITERGKYSARVFVDGSYEGDLMASAGVSWTIGREGRTEFGESLAGKQYPKAKMNIDGFDETGKPLPLITAVESGADLVGDENLMTYSFRLCLTEDSENRIPMPLPDNYDPKRFEVVRRAIKAGYRVGFDLYPLPGGKFDGNNSIGGQFSLGLVGGGRSWHLADQEQRQKIWDQHKEYTLEFFHFLTNDPAVPKATQRRYAKLGLCRDEFANSQHFPPALYVRESRRMRGLYVISQKDILESPTKTDPIAISSFPIDSHDCRRVALKEGGVINEGTIFPVRQTKPKQGYPYHVPYRAILPKPGESSNLLVPVALSCTHVGISSLRIEGTWMIIGQSAGIAAALAAEREIAVQDLAYPVLRERLLAQGQVLDLPKEQKIQEAGVIDDSEAELKGTWKHSALFKPHVGRGYIHDDHLGDGNSRASFTFVPSVTGPHDLLMAYSAHESRASNVTVVVSQGTVINRFKLNQKQPVPDASLFKPVGVLELQSDLKVKIEVSNDEANGFVVVDAIKLSPRKVAD